MPNFQAAVEAAYRFLLDRKIEYLPFNIGKILISEGFVIKSIAEYLSFVGDIENFSSIKHGCYTLCDDIPTILFDHQAPQERIRWTIAHEAGHYFLKHEKDGPIEEVEAHFFASEVYMPKPALLSIENRGYAVTPHLLKSCFYVSSEAAEKRLITLQRSSHKSKYDDEILHLFTPYLDSYFYYRKQNNQYSKWLAESQAIDKRFGFKY